MNERREKYTGLMRKFLAYPLEVIRDAVTLPLRIPTYALQLKESLADPEQRRGAMETVFLTILGVVSVGGIGVMGVQNPEDGKRILKAISLTLVLATIPGSIGTIRGINKNQ